MEDPVGLANVKRNKVMYFCELSPDHVITAEGFLLVQAIMANTHVR